MEKLKEIRLIMVDTLREDQLIKLLELTRKDIEEIGNKTSEFKEKRGKARKEWEETEDTEDDKWAKFIKGGECEGRENALMNVREQLSPILEMHQAVEARIMEKLQEAA